MPPPPPPPPGQSLKLSQVLPPPPQPVEVYIGKIPSFLPYGAVLRILESFGKVLRWTRPQVDRAFGFCIFAQEMGALRCTTILPSMTFGPRQESFVVKLGSRESEMLAAFTAVVSTEIEEDIRQRVREIAEGVLANGDAAASAPPPPERRIDPEDASLDPLVKAEIEEFRAASNARDKELETQRRAVVAAKIRELSRQRKREAEMAAQSPSKRAREGEEENGEIVDAAAAGTGAGGEAGDSQPQQPQQQQPAPAPAPAPDFGVMKIGAASLSLAKSKVAKQAARLFDQEFDDADKPARAIVPIDYSDPVAAPGPSHVPLTEKEIADMIPTSQEELFASSEFSWEAVAREGLLEGAIKAWCVKRMVGFYGQGETADSMARFVLQKLAAKCPPRELIAELVAVLDTEADQFVLRLWRMMVFLLIQARNRPPL